MATFTSQFLLALALLLLFLAPIQKKGEWNKKIWIHSVPLKDIGASDSLFSIATNRWR